jgi:hypothetical protein
MQLTNMTYEIKNEVQRTTAILNTINIFTAIDKTRIVKRIVRIVRIVDE